MNDNWGIGFSTVIDVQGFNYRTRNIDKFRAEFPTSQQSAPRRRARERRAAFTLMTRSTVTWLLTAKTAWKKHGRGGPYYATNPFTSGGFVWTGFDYRGEPTRTGGRASIRISG